MNQQKLQQAEHDFLLRFPGGFNNEALLEVIKKKHKVGALTTFVQQAFTKSAFNNSEQILEDFTKVISRCSMVAVFEKTGFRNQAKLFNSDEKQWLAQAVKQILHGNQTKGFEQLVGLLRPYKLAKWPLVTALANYYYPQRDVLIKPTTVKGVIATFNLSHLHYTPTPNFEFYDGYRQALLDMKAQVDPSLAPSNAAFSGFLMMSLENPDQP